MGRGRKCHYKNCDHNEVDNKAMGRRCKFYSLPKDRIRTAQWLHLGAVDHLTPKRVTAFNCFMCSCHFLNGRENGPVEYVEECDFDIAEEDLIQESEFNDELNVRKRILTPSTRTQSPPVKNRRVADLTPSSKLAMEALLLLTNVSKPIPKNCNYSPKKQLWRLRGSHARGSARKILHNMMDAAATQEQETYSELCDDLGVAHLVSPSHNTSVDFSDENNNLDDEVKSRCYSSQVSQDCSTTSRQLFLNYFPSQDNSTTLPTTPSASERGAPSPSGFPQPNVTFQERTFRSIGIQCDRGFLCYAKCKKMKEVDFRFYTGISQEVFEMIYQFLGGDEVCNKLKYEYDAKTPEREPFNWKLTAQDKLFLTLLRLRRGIPVRDLKVLFNISKYHASRICYIWTRFMSLQFKKLDDLMLTSAAAQNPLKPRCYEKFPNLRVIIDSTHFKIQQPKHFQQQNNTYSSYKAANTIKFLVVISCFGGLSFLSEGYEGSISDRQLLIQSGLMDRLQPEDAMMADRGFDCEDLCDEREVNLLIPAFLDQRTHFTARELILNRAIAVSRIHVETFIGLIKQFRLIRYIIPNSMLPIASDLVRVCAYLVNFQQPFIKDDNPEDNAN
ncbi:uncharacterized protein LOC113216260 isoform X1 [Frankliniella occidentalis]|uniref:Uncharacterized protein LOC113216260 isoform X1 n=1 Tax=Frankliniella occidentalis TaxID=133901 RepID=A0A6J1TET9_FRAOC|nr:uncharacterized protein LOC113216260 isoform X1 [Frankliniella occidentalis]